MSNGPSFQVSVSDPERVGDTLVIGLSNVGMAGMTAIDYLVRHRQCDQIGHVTARGVPSIAPFEDGMPRNHTRLHCLAGTGVTTLTSELYLPVGAAGAFVDTLLDWAVGAGIEEILVLNGVPFPHGPEEHAVFQVSTQAFRDRRGEAWNVPPLRGGFLDGVVGELISRSLEASSPATGVLVTPTHPPGPDLEAALLFLDAIGETYDVTVDVSELEQLIEETKQYYEELAERMESMDAGEDRDYPEDRAFM